MEQDCQRFSFSKPTETVKAALVVGAKAATLSSEGMLLNVLQDGQAEPAAKRRKIEKEIKACDTHAEQFGEDIKGSMQPVLLHEAVRSLLKT